MDAIKMNALKEGKASVRVKDALLRNHIAENNMKTSLKTIPTGLNKKEMDSLKYKQAFYQQRKKQLEASGSPPQKPRSKTALHRPTVGGLESRRTISDQTSFQSITELNSRPRALSSLTKSPSIEISDFDENGDSKIYTKLPSLPTSGNSQLNTGIPLRGRAKSASDISKDVAVFLDKTSPERRRLSSSDLTVDEYLAKRRRSSASVNLLASPMNTSAARSAPTSPVLARKLLADSQNQRSLGRKGNAKKKQVPSYDTQTDQVETLADSLNKIKFCRYLRDADDEEMLNSEEKLPNELKPKEIVLGHTKVVF